MIRDKNKNTHILFVYLKLFKFTFQISFLLVLFVVLRVRASNGDHLPYEPAENACERCNCTNIKSSLSEADGNAIKNVFQLDCSMKNFKHLLAGWPGDLEGDHQSELT